MANMTFKANIVPSTTDTYSLGSDDLRWNIYGDVDGNATNVTGTVAIANGGTGATTAADARTNLLTPTGNARIFYGTCATAAGTAAKVVTCAAYDALTVGDIIFVTFSNTNSTNTALTLSVNGTTAKSIKYLRNAAKNNIPSVGYILKDTPYMFVYDGTYWIIDVDYDTNTNTYVTQGATTTASWRQILLHKDTVTAWNSAVPSSGAGQAYASKNIAVQPSTGTIAATIFQGALTGNADTATGANLTTTAYGLAYYTNTAGAFGEIDPNTTSTKKFLSMTGTGSAGAVPSWIAITASDVLPAQTNNSGKFLTTNGSALSWSNVPLTVDYGTTLPLSGSNGDLYFTPPIGDMSSMVINSTTDKIYLTGIKAAGDTTLYYNSDVYAQGSVLYGAAWNDYAEYRESFEVNPGRVIIELGNGRLIRSTERLQPGAEIVSDTYGFVIGKGNPRCSTPVAISGRVLAYPYEERHTFAAGDAVCSGPNGTVSKMTREEIMEYPERIIGTVSEVPEYETWGPNNIRVRDRIWIRIR